MANTVSTHVHLKRLTVLCVTHRSLSLTILYVQTWAMKKKTVSGMRIANSVVSPCAIPRISELKIKKSLWISEKNKKNEKKFTF